MHAASYEKLRAFRDQYLTSETGPFRILDVGSGSESGDRSYRDLFDGPTFEYTGLDLQAGPNVDLVPSDPYNWEEISTNCYDAVISGQTFEHDPYFWITTAEIARVVRPGGLIAIVAPSRGHVHRFPLDCWRFYPDSWAALCAYVGVELVEGWTEPDSWRLVIPGVYWGDAMMVARKPLLTGETESQAFYSRLAAIVATRTALPVSTAGPGPAGREYEETHTLRGRSIMWHPGYAMRRINLDLRRRWPLDRIHSRIVVRNRRIAIERGASRRRVRGQPS